MYDHEEREGVFWKNTKLNRTIPACGLLFLFYYAFHKNLAVTFLATMSMWGFIRLYTFTKDVYMC